MVSVKDHMTDTAIHGAVAGLSAAFLEDIMQRLVTGVVVAVISSLIVHLLKKRLDK